jgi:ribA/ribD-fused uncharacterized protein
MEIEMKSTATSDICFYKANDKPYGAFSNLFRRTMWFEEKLFASAEHAYQFGKARNEKTAWWLMEAPSPSLLAMAAHGLPIYEVASDWTEQRRPRMRAVVEAKFTQHADLADILLSTEDRRIVETGTVNNAVNRRWGEVNGKGENWLGLILMEVRELLRATP